jgi:ParB/RepB/Spo0J family partition protein
MPKMEPASLTQKISLAKIIDTGNIREMGKYGPNEKGEYPEEIRELAESIKTNGQIQPVVVKEAGERDGEKIYELIAGFRRRAAFEYLRSRGDDYNMINASIITGDKLIIQLVENIQRADLTAREREAGIYQLLESGLKQNEIAAQLSKSKPYISIHISAYKMRLAAENAGIDTKDVETSAFRELLGIPEHNIIPVIDELVRLGGTSAVANRLAKEFKAPPELPPLNDDKPAPFEPDEPPPDNIDPLAGQNSAPDESSSEPAPLPPPDNTKPSPQKGYKPLLKTDEPERIEADHRIVDVNTILTIIYDYMEKKAVDKSEKTVCKNLIALIHGQLDNA